MEALFTEFARQVASNGLLGVVCVCLAAVIFYQAKERKTERAADEAALQACQNARIEDALKYAGIAERATAALSLSAATSQETVRSRDAMAASVLETQREVRETREAVRDLQRARS
jgi:hypothetical protein